MRETPNLRFNLGDAMVMIAAITPSLVLIRVGIGLKLFQVGKMIESGGRPFTLARQLVEVFNVGGGCILAGLVPAVLILGLYRAQPSRRDAARGAGSRRLHCGRGSLDLADPLVCRDGAHREPTSVSNLCNALQ